MRTLNTVDEINTVTYGCGEHALHMLGKASLANICLLVVLQEVLMMRRGIS